MAEHEDRLAAELSQLRMDINRLGDGTGSVAFGVLFDDDDVQVGRILFESVTYPLSSPHYAFDFCRNASNITRL